VNPKYTIICCILQVCGDFTWRMTDCEELVGQSHRMMGAMLYL